MNEKQELFINRVIDVLKWRMDIENSEFIECINEYCGQYCKTHLSTPGLISQDDLNSICNIVNNIFNSYNSKLRVTNSMGEFIPAKLK